MSSLPTSLLRAAQTLPAAQRSLFITISLPPHLFDITYSVWKYCPFCPLLHHLLMQSRVCVWVRSSWHTQEVNTFTSPEIADSGRGGGGHAHAPEPHTPIAPQLRSLSWPSAIVPGVINAQPSFHPRLPSPRPRRACCNQGNNGRGRVPGTKTTAALPGRALQPPCTMAMCNPIPLPASE